MSTFDNACLEQLAFGLAYITKLDPMWNDDELTFIFKPDGSLLGIIAARAACTSNCILAIAGFLWTLVMNAEELRPFPRQLAYQQLQVGYSFRFLNARKNLFQDGRSLVVLDATKKSLDRHQTANEFGVGLGLGVAIAGIRGCAHIPFTGEQPVQIDPRAGNGE